MPQAPMRLKQTESKPKIDPRDETADRTIGTTVEKQAASAGPVR